MDNVLAFERKMFIYDAAMKYKTTNTPLIVLAGKNMVPGLHVTGQPKGPPVGHPSGYR